MSAKVSVENGLYQISIPVKEVYANQSIQEFLAVLRGQQIVAGSEASEEDIEALAEEVTSSWWEKNKKRIIDGLGD